MHDILLRKLCTALWCPWLLCWFQDKWLDCNVHWAKTLNNNYNNRMVIHKHCTPLKRVEKSTKIGHTTLLNVFLFKMTEKVRCILNEMSGPGISMFRVAFLIVKKFHRNPIKLDSSTVIYVVWYCLFSLFSYPIENLSIWKYDETYMINIAFCLEQILKSVHHFAQAKK